MPATLLDHNIQPYADLEAMLATSHKAMVVAATGAGKTSVTVKYLEDHNLQGLVVCPKVSICKQWDTASDNIITMTYQKFCNGPDVSAYDCYIFDEAHHTGASKWGKAVKGLMASTDKPVIGLTADPKRYLDGGRDMGQELWDGNVVYGVDLDEAIQKGILPGGIFVSALFDAGAELEKYRNIPVTDTLKGRLETCTENCLSITEILHKHMPEGKRKGIVFTDCIDRIQESVALIQAAYPFEPVSFIHSNRSQKQNAEVLMNFNRSEHGFIVTVDMLNEGVHIPDVNTIIMLRRTSSPNVFMQQLGRGFSPSSKDVVIFDFVGNNCSLKIIAEHINCANGGKSSPDDVTAKLSSQFIVYDYATPVVELLDDVKRFLNGAWTQEEDNILRAHYTDMGSQVTVLLPGRTLSACHQRARQLDLTKSGWTKEEDDLLLAHYADLGPKIISLFPNRTWYACRNRACRLGLGKEKSAPWTHKEIKILQTYYPKEGKKVVARLPGRTEAACKQKSIDLGLRIGSRPWTEEEDQIFRKYYPIEGTEVRLRLPGRTKASCTLHANKLGIHAVTPWTKKEDNILKKYYLSEGAKSFARLPQRGERACYSRVQKLGLRVKTFTWSKEEEEILRKYYSTEGPKVANRLPGRTEEACRTRAAILNLYDPRNIKNVKWTEEEDNVLREFYPSEGTNVAARLPGRTKGSCKKRAGTIGVKIGALCWSETEDNILREYYPTEAGKVSRRLQNRAAKSCIARARKLGIRYGGSVR